MVTCTVRMYAMEMGVTLILVHAAFYPWALNTYSTVRSLFPSLVSHPHSNVKAIQKLNETELRLGLDSKTSWHDEYKDSAYIFVGERKYVLVYVG